MSTNRQAGLSMIEMVVFIVIIGVAVAGVLSTLTYTASRSADPVQRKQAMLIAEALLDEISLARMTFCHPDDPAAESAKNAGECATAETVGASSLARPYYNINDYVASFNTPTSITPGDTSGKITDVLGSLQYGGKYTAMVTIRADATLGPVGATAIAGAAAGGATPANAADTNLLQISVAVKYGNGESITLDRYCTRYAPNHLP